jgi:hypothetical protein
LRSSTKAVMPVSLIRLMRCENPQADKEADAAVATAAAMNVTESSCTGIGGGEYFQWSGLAPFWRTDNFCLFYDAKTKKVGGINASGKAPKALTLDYLRKQGITGDTVSPLISGHFGDIDPLDTSG